MAKRCQYAGCHKKIAAHYAVSFSDQNEKILQKKTAGLCNKHIHRAITTMTAMIQENRKQREVEEARRFAKSISFSSGQ